MMGSDVDIDNFVNSLNNQNQEYAGDGVTDSFQLSDKYIKNLGSEDNNNFNIIDLKSNIVWRKSNDNMF